MAYFPFFVDVSNGDGLIVGGGRVKTLALVLVPYIQGGDRSLASVYALAFTGSALLVSALFEALIRHWQKRGDRL